MTTLIEKARKNIITPEMEFVAETERVTPEFIRSGIAEGNIVITQNKKRNNIEPLAIGGGLRTKINANIGTSGDKVDVDVELKKLKVAIESGADTVMDLSTGGDHQTSRIRRKTCGFARENTGLHDKIFLSGTWNPSLKKPSRSASRRRCGVPTSTTP